MTDLGKSPEASLFSYEDGRKLQPDPLAAKDGTPLAPRAVTMRVRSARRIKNLLPRLRRAAELLPGPPMQSLPSCRLAATAQTRDEGMSLSDLSPDLRQLRMPGHFEGLHSDNDHLQLILVQTSWIRPCEVVECTKPASRSTDNAPSWPASH